MKALEPLFDLQEAQGKTSNMAPKPTFRRGNLEKSSAPYWCDAPNLGAPKFFWEASYTYILRIKRVFEVLSNFTFCWTNPPQIPDYLVIIFYPRKSVKALIAFADEVRDRDY